jgi:hypothetical protein
LNPATIVKAKPDYILILPWNIAEEIKCQLSLELPNTKFVAAIPKMRIL